MTFEEIWQRMVDRNPKLAEDDGELTISVRHLKQIAERFYVGGSEGGVRKTTVFDSLFGSKG